MGASSAGVITAGIGLVVIGIGLLVASTTRGELLLTKVFHPRKGKPFDDSVARTLKWFGIAALVIGVVVALAPPVVSVATTSSGQAASTTTPMTTTPALTTTSQPPITSPTSTTAPETTSPSTTTTSTPDNGGASDPNTSLPTLLLSQLTPLEGVDDFSTQPVRLGGTQYLNPVRLDPAICGKRQANYDIGGMGYTTFSATAVGLSDTYDDQEDKSWTFGVYAVGGNGATPLFQQIMSFGQVAHINVSISGVVRLRLEVDWIDRGGLPTCSPLNDFSAVWGDPTLRR